MSLGRRIGIITRKENWSVREHSVHALAADSDRPSYPGPDGKVAEVHHLGAAGKD